ncbi:hypothetical protein [Streptomyces sp. NBC_00503]|uniref:hypothetical protein n=1 Tax=Streptomyces sp. NBC_00503 TaxID=2903659 RepID=UPI002E80B835|nr:hypothetical protein [Streptomyces sp. NBC_00503]WUD85660.1 hypothetical protein OG490_36750 [Streptomyces sp. NBC_00503]
MPPSIHHIRSVAGAYLARHSDEHGSFSLLFAALVSPNDPTSLNTFPAHVPCSAIVKLALLP